MKGSSNLFRKNRPVAAPSYVDMATRSKKISRREKDSVPNPNLKKLTPSTSPLKFGPAQTDSSSSGFLYMLAIFVIVFITMNLIFYFTS